MSKPVAGDLGYLVVPPILGVLMYPYLKQHRAALLRLLRPADVTARVILLSLALGLSLRITYWAGATVLIWLGLLGDRHGPSGPAFGFDCPAPPVVLLSLVVMAVLIPVIEEAINRGFLLHALLPRGHRLAIVVSAALFALMHRPDMYPVAFLIGLLLAVQTLNYGTLWAPILAHASYNAAAVLDWECLRVVWNPPPSDPLLAKAALIAAPLAVLGAAVAAGIARCKATGAR